MISDFYPKAIGAVVNDRVVAEGENSQVKHRGGASKAIFFIIRRWLVKSLGDVLNSDQGIIDLELCNGVLDTKTEPANKMHIGESEMFSTPSHVVAHLVLSIILTSNLCQCCPSLRFKPCFFMQLCLCKS